MSRATLICSPVFHSQPPFPSFYFSLSGREFLASDLLIVLQRAGSVIVQCALHGQDRITSNIIVPEYLLALKVLC